MDNQTTNNTMQTGTETPVTTARPQVSDAARIRSKVFCILSVLLYVFSILSLCLVYFGGFEFSGLLKSYEGYIPVFSFAAGLASAIYSEEITEINRIAKALIITYVVTGVLAILLFILKIVFMFSSCAGVSMGI
ncbi:MAG: hypothetical protein K5881_04320 [Saccharofermentans sp.]|nr:hypothetical protein [Saccharofermentans sp.]